MFEDMMGSAAPFGDKPYVVFRLKKQSMEEFGNEQLSRPWRRARSPRGSKFSRPQQTAWKAAPAMLGGGVAGGLAEAEFDHCSAVLDLQNRRCKPT
jgi:hypothetical protein